MLLASRVRWGRPVKVPSVQVDRVYRAPVPRPAIMRTGKCSHDQFSSETLEGVRIRQVQAEVNMPSSRLFQVFW